MAGSLQRVLIGVRVPVGLARQLKITAAQRGTTVQALIEEALRAFLGKGKRGTHGAE
jgi:predicted DNA binding CopG/RHH family protein